ncbi:hypothetical protein LTR72_012037, partial [Exophiala xenobiotica]
SRRFSPPADITYPPIEAGDSIFQRLDAASQVIGLTEEVVELRKSKLGADHPDALRSMHNLAYRYSEAGRRAEALQLTEKVVELQTSKLGADHPDTLASQKFLASLSQGTDETSSI